MKKSKETEKDDFIGLWALLILMTLFTEPKDTLIIDIQLGDDK